MKLLAVLFVLVAVVATCDAYANCIKFVKVDANTGDVARAQSKNAHHLAFVLRDGSKLVADLQGFKSRGEPYVTELDFDVDFEDFGIVFEKGKCVRRSDITEVHLLANGRIGWFIASISVSTSSTDSLDYRVLTSDPKFGRWVDGNGNYPYDSQDHFLTLLRVRDRHVVDCGFGISACECRESADECEFDMEIDEIRTFTRYQILPSGRAITVRGTHGVVFYIDDDGNPQPVRANRFCSDNPNCTDPLFVDGKTYRLAIAVNGQIPGPDLIVHEEQTVIVNVKNNLTTEGISVHWHGLHQIGTPWMDGVGQISQCHIGPSSYFQYIFLASPSGTFWYHSHSGGQRTDGLFGALIVRESAQRINSVKEALEPFGLDEFEDLPGEHTLTMLDWQQESTLDLFTQLNSGLGFFTGNPIGKVPTSGDTRYRLTPSYDNTFIGSIPYFSGLINGRGRHEDVPYTKTRLSVFTVEQGNRYRFRLIGSQGLYAYRFSIDGHKLTVVATDGYWIRPVEDVDFIIVNSGERYDFFIDMQNETAVENYWIRAETLEVFTDSTSAPPYQSRGHIAEAILHYRQQGEIETLIPSTEYEAIKDNSPVLECTQSNPCRAVNCPFENFHPSYYIDCINVNELSLLLPTPPGELPDADPDPNCLDCTHFLNFNYEGESETTGINGRNFILPAHPPQTQNAQFLLHDNICDLNANCNPSDLDCRCVHVRYIPYRYTIQLVVSAVGRYLDTHPLHLHGHSFHVVHMGFPEYNADNGFVSRNNMDIQCADENCTATNCHQGRCTQPSWRNQPNFTISDTTVRKDTVIIPPGGYVVINFIADNPGYWFLHCHIEAHVLEGMSVVFNEGHAHLHNLPPDGLNQCGDFFWDTEDFEEKLEFDPYKG